MKVLTAPRTREQRNVISMLETVNVETGERKLLAEFETLIEAPNWTIDGKFLVFNREGRICLYNLESGPFRLQRPVMWTIATTTMSSPLTANALP